VHILHVSSCDALPLIATARRDGVRVTAETCPHYLTFAAEEVPDGATEFKCCPPIRGPWNRESLWQSLADGTIDAIVSDHSPSTPSLKEFGTGDFAAAWGGIASLQLGLRVIWTEASTRGHGLGDVVRWMATNPARIAGLTTKGRIAPGYDADLVAFDPAASSTVDPAALRHRHPVTPYAGRTVRGAVSRVWLRGEPATPDDPPRGRLIARGTA
jgi:allantoinase